MDETMNLNGMGVGNTTLLDVNATNNPSESIDKQEIKNANSEISNVSSSQSAIVDSKDVTNESNTVEAGNEIDFEDLDMIKELRAEEEASRKKESIFSSMDFGPLKKYLEDDDVTDISYSNGGQLWLKTLSKGVYRVDEGDINDALIEKIAFQCSNVMGKTFNMAHPFLDSESAELRMNFIHDSIARNGIAVVFRKTPAKIRLEKEKLMKENYVSLSIHDFLIKAVQGHCNIIMCGETGSGKTEFLKYLASHTFENEKIVTVEDTLELHLDRIYPHRDIVAMKTNNVASYSDVLVTCMRQNPIWILLSEVRSAEAVTAVRNSISSGHFILSTIHADKAANIPYRLYSLLESNIDVEQFLNTIYRYVQIGVFLRGRFDPRQGRYVREIGEVTEFYVNENNECITNTIYQKTIRGDVTYKPISEHLLEYLEGQGMDMKAIREANGDLEKAQDYIDELSNKTEEKNKDEINENKEEQQGEEKSTSAAELSEKDKILEEIKTLNEKRGINITNEKPIVQNENKVEPTLVQAEPVVLSTVEEKNTPTAELSEKDKILEEIKTLNEKRGINITKEKPVVQTENMVEQIPVQPEVKPITEDIKPVLVIPTVPSMIEPTPIETTNTVPVADKVDSPVIVSSELTPVQPEVKPITEDIKPVSVIPTVPSMIEPTPIETTNTVPVTDKVDSSVMVSSELTPVQPEVKPITEDIKPVPVIPTVPYMIEPTPIETTNTVPVTDKVDSPVMVPSELTPVQPEVALTTTPTVELQSSVGIENIIPIENKEISEKEVVTPVIQDIKTLMTPIEKPQPTKPLVDIESTQQNNLPPIPNSLFDNDNESGGNSGIQSVNFTVPNITNIQ